MHTTHGRIFDHLLHPSEPDDQENLCCAALLHPSGNWEWCDHLLDVPKSKPPVKAGPMRNQFKTPGGVENLESKVSWRGGHWYAIPRAASMAQCP
jgi:hypothetical protein